MAKRHQALLIVLVLLGGCAVETAEETSGLAQGLTVLEAGDGVLTLAYRAGDDVIFMESLRGRPTAEIYQRDPEQPDFEMDTRFTSDDGRTFYSARGGDQWQDPSWLEGIEQQDAEHPSGSNEHLFELATDAAAAIPAALEEQLGAGRVADFGPEIHAILSFGERALDIYREQNENFITQIRANGGAPIVTEEVTGDTAYGTGGPEDGDWYTDTAGYYALGVHDKTIYLVGKHSATQLLYWNGGWVTVHDNCNHGECASGMGTKCYLQYYDSITPWNTNRMYQQSCDTGYDWDSNNGHNCHDDTRVQEYNKYYGASFSGYSYWCNDNDSSADISAWPGDNGGSPECNSGTSTGYRHPWM